MQEKEILLKLEDVYGGDGFERPDTVEEVKLERSKEKITVRKDIGIPVKKERSEKQVEIKDIKVHTFRRDDDGTPLYRLGGPHGKLWGLLKEAGYNMYQSGEQENKITTDRVLRAVRISPQWVRLQMGDGVEIKTDVLPQELSGRSSSMITMHYDVIPECEAEVTMKYPDVYEDLLMKYLDRAQTMAFGNKRRGVLTVVKAK